MLMYSRARVYFCPLLRNLNETTTSIDTEIIERSWQSVTKYFTDVKKPFFSIIACKSIFNVIYMH